MPRFGVKSGIDAEASGGATLMRVGWGGLWLLVALGPCLSTSQAAGRERLAMPFACAKQHNQLKLSPAPRTSYDIIGKRRSRAYSACVGAAVRACESWKIHRFSINCGGAKVPWSDVFVAIASRRAELRTRRRAGRIHITRFHRPGGKADCYERLRSTGSNIALFGSASFDDCWHAGRYRASRPTFVLPAGYAPVHLIGARIVAGSLSAPIAIASTIRPWTTLERPAPGAPGIADVAADAASASPADQADKGRSEAKDAVIGIDPVEGSRLPAWSNAAPLMASMNEQTVAGAARGAAASFASTAAPPAPTGVSADRATDTVPPEPSEHPRSQPDLVWAPKSRPSKASSTLVNGWRTELISPGQPPQRDNSLERGEPAASADHRFSVWSWSTAATASMALLAFLLALSMVRAHRQDGQGGRTDGPQGGGHCGAALTGRDPGAAAVEPPTTGLAIGHSMRDAEARSAAQLIDQAHRMLSAARASLDQLPATTAVRQVLARELHAAGERLASLSTLQPSDSTQWKSARSRAQSLTRELQRLSAIADGASSSLADGPSAGAQLEEPRDKTEAYALLGVNPDVNERIVKKLVEALRQSWHPDHARDEDDRRNREQRIKRINVAWDLIQGRRSEA